METIIAAAITGVIALIICLINNHYNMKRIQKDIRDDIGDRERKDAERDKREAEREEAREEMSIVTLEATTAAIALGEATARAVQRIPDAHCNGDMHKALEYASEVKHRQQNFLLKKGVKYVHDTD